MHFFKFLTLCAARAVLSSPLPDSPTDLPDSSSVKILSVVWNGSGCHMGSTSDPTNQSPADTNFVLSTDRRTLTIIYSKYIAQWGVPGNPAIPRSNCLMNIQVSYPPTWRYSISQTTFHGFAQVDRGCTAYVKASYWFSGETQEVGAQYDFDPNVYATGQDYARTTVVKAIFPRCGVQTMLNINSEADSRCSGPGMSMLTVDSTDQKFEQVYNFQWQRC